MKLRQDPKSIGLAVNAVFLLVSGPLSGRRSNLEIREGGSNFSIIICKHAAVEIKICFEGAPEGFGLVWFPIIWL